MQGVILAVANIGLLASRASAHNDSVVHFIYMIHTLCFSDNSLLMWHFHFY